MCAWVRGLVRVGLALPVADPGNGHVADVGRDWSAVPLLIVLVRVRGVRRGEGVSSSGDCGLCGGCCGRQSYRACPDGGWRRGGAEADVDLADIGWARTSKNEPIYEARLRGREDVHASLVR